MESDPERRRLGLETMASVYGWDSVGDGEGEFFGYTVEHLFADIWNRPGLSRRDRRLLLFGLLVGNGDHDVVPIQLAAALANDELDAEALREMAVFLSHYAGLAGRGPHLHPGRGRPRRPGPGPGPAAAADGDDGVSPRRRGEVAADVGPTTGRSAPSPSTGPRPATPSTSPSTPALASALDEARADDGVHVVVLTGAGHVFSAGQDLDEMTALATGTAPEGAEHGLPSRLLAAVEAFDKPLLAAVNGAGVGIGFTLLAHCDLVWMADTARLRVPFAEMGVPPEAASSMLLPQRMGRQQAARILLTGDWVGAEEAVALGLAVGVVPADELAAAVAAEAARIAAHPLAGLRAVAGLLRAGRGRRRHRGPDREEAAFADLLASLHPARPRADAPPRPA